MLGLDLLTLVSEEFVRPDSPLPDARAKELKASLIYVLPDVLRVLAEVRHMLSALPVDELLFPIRIFGVSLSVSRWSGILTGGLKHIGTWVRVEN